MPATRKTRNATQNDTKNGTHGVKPKKQLILNAFVMNTPGHLSPGLWKHPRNHTDKYKKLSFWTELAQLLDKAGFHAMFIADTLGAYDVYKGPHNFEPGLAAGAQVCLTLSIYSLLEP
jgi:hypothetical protein